MTKQEDIKRVLSYVEHAKAQGFPVMKALKLLNVPSATYYKWRKKENDKIKSINPASEVSKLYDVTKTLKAEINELEERIESLESTSLSLLQELDHKVLNIEKKEKSKGFWPFNKRSK